MASNVSVFDPSTQQDISRMTEQYAGMLEPQYQQARKRLTQSLAGTGGLYGSPAQYGASNIEAARLGQIGQYGLGLSEKAQEQAWNKPFQEAALTGMYGGQKTLAGQQAAMQMQYQPQLWQSQLATEAQQRELTPQQFALNKALSEAGLTGQYGGQQTLAGQQLAAQLANQQFQQGLQAGQLTGMYGGQQTLEAQQLALNKALQEAGLTGQYGGQQTLQGQQIASQLAMDKLQQQYQPQLWQEQLATSQAQRDLAGKQFGLQEAGITGQYGGQQTLANKLAQQEQLNAMLPYILQGYLSPTSGTAMPGYTYATEKALTQQTPEYQLAQKYGFSSPIEMELIGAYDPDRLKRILAGQEIYGAPTTKTIPSDLKFADFEVGGRARV
jgi:hypothetical protein